MYFAPLKLPFVEKKLFHTLHARADGRYFRSLVLSYNSSQITAMKKYPVLFFIILVCSCHSTETNKPVTADPIDLTARDTSVRPQDNFFLYANGGWIKKTVIPASQSGWGLASILYDTTLGRMHFLLDSLSALTNTVKNSPSQQVADLYYSAMD